MEGGRSACTHLRFHLGVSVFSPNHVLFEGVFLLAAVTGACLSPMSQFRWALGILGVLSFGGRSASTHLPFDLGVSVFSPNHIFFVSSRIGVVPPNCRSSYFLLVFPPLNLRLCIKKCTTIFPSLQMLATPGQNQSLFAFSLCVEGGGQSCMSNGNIFRSF